MIQLAGGFQYVETAESGQDVLTHLAVLSMAFGNLQVLIGTAGLHAEEHARILSLRSDGHQIKTHQNQEIA